MLCLSLSYSNIRFDSDEGEGSNGEGGDGEGEARDRGGGILSAAPIALSLLCSGPAKVSAARVIASSLVPATELRYRDCLLCDLRDLRAGDLRAGDLRAGDLRAGDLRAAVFRDFLRDIVFGFVERAV